MVYNLIFRIAEAKDLTPEKLQEFINKNRMISTDRYEKLKKAYETKYDIFDLPKKPEYKPDNRIAVNFAKYITDTMNGFFIGIPIKVTSRNKAISDYINLLDKYNDQDDNNAELAKTCLIYGRGYEMYFVDDAGQIGITYLNPLESFMIYDESIIEKPLFFVRTYTDSNNVQRGSISDSRSVRYFTINPTLKYDDEDEHPHGFDGVPAVEYVCNAERQGIFESVLSMINAYNKAVSEKANDVDYFADAYMKVLGAKLDQGDLSQIRTNRIINFDGVGDGNLVVEFMAKPDADQTQEHLIDRLERLIFTISMVANINDENFGTSSGIAMKFRLQSMSNLAKTLERKFTSGMNRRYKLIFSNPVSQMKVDDWVNIEYKFTPNFPANELEESQIAGNLRGIVSDETLLGFLSIVEDAKKELERIEAEKDDTSYNTGYPTDRFNNNNDQNGNNGDGQNDGDDE